MENIRHNFLTKLFIVLCFVLFMFGVYYLGRQSVKPIEVPVGVLPKTTAIPTTISYPTANWKTYKSDKVGVTFNHPSSWSVYEAGEYQGKFVALSNQKCEQADPRCVETEMGGNCPASPACETLQIRLITDVKTVQELFKHNEYYKNIKQINFANFPAYKSIYTWLSTDGTGMPTIDVQVGESVYEISYWNEDTNSESQQVISSLKFTENKVETEDQVSALFALINKELKTNLISRDIDHNFIEFPTVVKSKHLDLAKYSRNSGTVESIVVNFGLELDHDQTRHTSTDWTETYKSSQLVCNFVGNNSSYLDLFCANR